MFGLFGETGDVSLNVLRSRVVVVEDGGCLVAHNVPHLSNPNVEGEDAMHDGEYEQMELIQAKLSDSKS